MCGLNLITLFSSMVRTGPDHHHQQQQPHQTHHHQPQSQQQQQQNQRMVNGYREPPPPPTSSFSALLPTSSPPHHNVTSSTPVLTGAAATAAPAPSSSPSAPLPAPPVSSAEKDKSPVSLGAFPPLGGSSAATANPAIRPPPLDYSSIRTKITGSAFSTPVVPAAAEDTATIPPMLVNQNSEWKREMPGHAAGPYPPVRRHTHNPQSAVTTTPVSWPAMAAPDLTNPGGPSQPNQQHNGPPRRGNFSTQRSVPLDSEPHLVTPTTTPHHAHHTVENTALRNQVVVGPGGGGGGGSGLETIPDSSKTTNSVMMQNAVALPVALDLLVQQQQSPPAAIAPAVVSTPPPPPPPAVKVKTVVGNFPQVYSMNLQHMQSQVAHLQNGPRLSAAAAAGNLSAAPFQAAPAPLQPHPQLQSYQNHVLASSSCYLCGESGHVGEKCPRKPTLKPLDAGIPLEPFFCLASFMNSIFD